MKEVDFEGVIYQIGSNAKDNWNVLDNAKQNWLWFHLDNLTSPYVVIKEDLKNLKSNIYDLSWKNYIIYAGVLCKENSKHKSYKVNCIWTEIKNVKKGSNIGEALIKGKINKFNI